MVEVNVMKISHCVNYNTSKRRKNAVDLKRNCYIPIFLTQIDRLIV